MFSTNCESRRFVGVSVGGRWAVFSLCILHVLQCNLLANPWPAPRHSTGFRGALQYPTNQKTPRQSTGSTDHVMRFKTRSGGGALVARPEAAPGNTAGGGGQAGATSSAELAGRTRVRGRPQTTSGSLSSCRSVVTVRQPRSRATSAADWRSGRTGCGTAM